MYSVGLVEVTRPCSFCSVTIKTRGLIPQAVAIAWITWAAEAWGFAGIAAHGPTSVGPVAGVSGISNFAFFKQSIAGSVARQSLTLESKNLWISPTDMVPKSKNTLSLMIKPGSNAVPGGAAWAVCGSEMRPLPTSAAVTKTVRTFFIRE